MHMLLLVWNSGAWVWDQGSAIMKQTLKPWLQVAEQVDKAACWHAGDAEGLWCAPCQPIHLVWGHEREQAGLPPSYATF